MTIRDPIESLPTSEVRSRELTKTGVSGHREYQIFAEERDDGRGTAVTVWFASIGYRVQTAEGEDIRRGITLELADPDDTNAEALYTRLLSLISTEESIT